MIVIIITAIKNAVRIILREVKLKNNDYNNKNAYNFNVKSFNDNNNNNNNNSNFNSDNNLKIINNNNNNYLLLLFSGLLK